MAGQIPDRLQDEGWRGQLLRVERWRYRALAALHTQADGGGDDDASDFLYAFFQNAYHLRDFLLKSGATNRASLDQLMGKTPALGLCRDVCNGSKHLHLDRTHGTERFGMMRESVAPTSDSPAGGTRLRMISFQDRKGVMTYEYIEELADEIVSAWQIFCATIPAS